MSPAYEKRVEILSTVFLQSTGLLTVLMSLLALLGADCENEPWKWLKGAVPPILLAVGILALTLGLARVLSKYKKRLPHDRVYVRLGTSSIHGIGLFYDDSEMAWFEKRIIDDLDLPEEIDKLYKDFRVLKNGHYGCPKNFNLITPSWYQNHSDKPNTYWDDEYNLFALRDIEKGEELAIDYRMYSAITLSNITA